MDFVDTNLLLYAVGRDERSAAKRETARQLLPGGDFAISPQVLGEFFTNAIRPDKAALSEEEAALHCDIWRRNYFVSPLTGDSFDRAIKNRSRYQTSYWDSLILAAAQESHCQRIYTEDLHHGQDYGGVIAHNPFLKQESS